MIFRYLTLLMLLFGGFFVYVGCDSTQREVIDAMRVDDPKPEMPGTPVILVAFVNAPEGGEDAYLQWAASVSSVIQAAPHIKTITSYDNYYGESPHRLVMREFANPTDVDAYIDLEETKAIQAELDQQAGSWVRHTFALRSDSSNPPSPFGE